MKSRIILPHIFFTVFLLLLLLSTKAHKMVWWFVCLFVCFLGKNCVIKILPNLSTKHFMTDIQYRAGNKAGKLNVSEITPSYWIKWHKTVSTHVVIFPYTTDKWLPINASVVPRKCYSVNLSSPKMLQRLL